MDKLKSYLKNVKYTPFIPGLIVVLSAIVGIRMSWIAANLESAVALWIWGLVLYLPFYTHDLSKERFCTRDSMVAAWILVPISILILYFWYPRGAIVLLLLAGTLFFGNFRMGGYVLGSLLVWLIFLPHLDYFHHFVSYPLRIIGAKFSVEILQMCGFDASVIDTEVSITGRRIAITAACSGIQQLEAMLLVGWILAYTMQKQWMERLLHFVLLLPIIIFSNIVRIILTLLGIVYIGDVILSDSVHSGMGFGMVLLTVILFVGAGKLFSEKKEKPESTVDAQKKD